MQIYLGTKVFNVIDLKCGTSNQAYSNSYQRKAYLKPSFDGFSIVGKSIQIQGVMANIKKKV